MSEKKKLMPAARVLLILLAVILCAAFMPAMNSTAFAKTKKPGKISYVKISKIRYYKYRNHKYKAARFKISWKKSKNATGYDIQVFRVDTDSVHNLYWHKDNVKKSSVTGHLFPEAAGHKFVAWVFPCINGHRYDPNNVSKVFKIKKKKAK